MKRIFITGASGCIGHYITEALIQQTDHELFLLVRNPQKLRLKYLDRSRVHLLREISAVSKNTAISCLKILIWLF